MTKAIAKKRLVAIALFLSGGLLAMNLVPGIAAKAGTVAPSWNSMTVAAPDLGAKVDWSKVKHEPMAPTF